jgi:Na+-transporting methylmalonyl-CoA/oxaloacetate decarboxylase beta subunit
MGPGRSAIEEIVRQEAGSMVNPKMLFIGEVTQIAGVAAIVGGLVLSLHHWPAAAALIGGATAYLVGKKLRAQ